MMYLYYSASTLLGMQTVVIATAILSVRHIPVFCHESTIVRSSASGMKIILVSGELKFIRIFAGDHPQGRC